ncbi:hypothetical protein ACFSKW_14255 [Nonomuraea mangrovi]|uniref:Uncharacterized protein n=1 Tax=Nonomuraea mangrovi TaxID=2316207 RepID=A0ABW4SUM2_9ACTN
MTRKRWAVVIALAAVLSLVALAWVTTEHDRRLDRHVRQTLERYEQAFARDGARAAPAPAAPVLQVPFVPFVEKVIVHHDGRTLTAEFTGARATGPCGADYPARAVESEHAAVIVVEERPHEGGRVCSAMGYLRQVTVRLSSPLGSRTVLEVKSGMPVPVDLAE